MSYHYDQDEWDRLTKERDDLIIGFRAVEAMLGTLDHVVAIDEESQLRQFVEDKASKTINQLRETRSLLDNAMRLLRGRGFHNFNPTHPIWKQYEELPKIKSCK